MNTVVAIKGTNGSGKSTVVRELIARLGKQSILRVNSKEAGYRCKYEDGSLFVLGKYKTAACGGLDSSFSYGGAADDLLLCIDKLAPKGHVVCEGVIAITSYGFGKVTRFATKLKRTGHRMIFARIDTPAEVCVERVKQRRLEAGNTKPFNPEGLLHKYESILKSQEKLRQAGYDARILPHEEPLQTLLRWFEERNP
jgi:predicted ABC-type ATPase